jgi:hypothetical protein
MVTLGIAGAAAGTVVAAHNGLNFGLYRYGLLDAHSVQVFGVVKPVEASSRESIDSTEANAHPTHLVTVAKGLQARVVSANPNLGSNIDMMLLWPNDINPSHIIACNEGGVGDPGVQRIRVSDGAVETILTGTNSCDPVRAAGTGSFTRMAMGQRSAATTISGRASTTAMMTTCCRTAVSGSARSTISPPSGPAAFSMRPARISWSACSTTSAATA